MAPKMNQKSLYGDAQRDQAKTPPSLGHVGDAEWVPKGTKKVCMGMTNVTTRSPPKGTKKVCMGRTNVTKRSPLPLRLVMLGVQNWL